MSEATAVARAIQNLHDGVVTPDYEVLLSHGYHRFLTQIPAATVIDVGAHHGLHVEQFGRLAERVIAFEPLPKFAALLQDRFRDHPHITVRAVALGREPRRSRFFQLQQSEAGMSGLLLRADATNTPHAIEVDVDTLDRQAADLSRLDYIKIDIEGGEVDCLRGGRRTITRHRPIISVEYGSPGYTLYTLYGHTAMTLFDLAQELDYVPSDLFGNLIETAAEWMAICDAAYWDYFLVPRERRAEWRDYFSGLTCTGRRSVSAKSSRTVGRVALRPSCGSRRPPARRSGSRRR